MNEMINLILGLGILVVLGAFTFYLFKTYFGPKRLYQI